MNKGEDEQQTCGKGLSSNAAIPEGMAKLLEATANVLENHTRSLNAKEANGNQELTAYEQLVQDHRAAAARLSALAQLMKDYRDLPMAEHELSVLTDARSIDLVDSLVRQHQELITPLQERLVQYNQILEAMRRK